MTSDIEILRAGWPAELRQGRRYLGYRLTTRASGRQGKVPVRVVNNGRAYPVNPHDPLHHVEFEQALDLMEGGQVDGVALVLSEVRGVQVCAVDLDDVVDGGVPTTDARTIVRSLDSYTEISRSGRGLHVVLAGSLPAGPRRGNGVEILTSGVLAITGHRLEGTAATVEPRMAELRALHARMIPVPSQPPTRPTRDVPDLNDEVVLRRLRSARNRAKFAALYERGDLAAYDGDASRADLALLRMFAWYTRDPARLERLWRRSALWRPERWARPCRREGTTRLTYAEVTLQRALELSGDAASLRGGGGHPDSGA